MKGVWWRWMHTKNRLEGMAAAIFFSSFEQEAICGLDIFCTVRPRDGFTHPNAATNPDRRQREKKLFHFL